MLQNAEVIVGQIFNGKKVVRELYLTVNANLNSWGNVREAWMIKQTVFCNKTKKETIEQRFFLTSISPKTLTDPQVMQAIRIHWGVENNGLWILDTAGAEDNSPWANRAMRFVSLLRLLVYNTVSRLITRRLRSAHARELSWVSLIKIIEHACCRIRQAAIIVNFANPATLS